MNTEQHIKFYITQKLSETHKHNKFSNLQCESAMEKMFNKKKKKHGK